MYELGTYWMSERETTAPVPAPDGVAVVGLRRLTPPEMSDPPPDLRGAIGGSYCLTIGLLDFVGPLIGESFVAGFWRGLREATTYPPGP